MIEKDPLLYFGVLLLLVIVLVAAKNVFYGLKGGDPEFHRRLLRSRHCLTTIPDHEVPWNEDY